MIDSVVLGIIAALALFAWRVIRIQKQEGNGCCGCHGCGGSCPREQEEHK